MKCGPTARSRRSAAPDRHAEPGQRARAASTLIARMGADKVEAKLPPLVPRREARRRKRWCGRAIPCTATPITVVERLQDPPLRRASSSEVKASSPIHRAEGSHAGGVHFEMTGQNVTECVGGASRDHRRTTSTERYETHCDPAAQRQPGARARLPARRAARRPSARAVHAWPRVRRFAVEALVDGHGGCPMTHPTNGEIERCTDHYFNRSRRRVDRASSATARVTYAIFMRRPVVFAPRLALDWLEATGGGARHRGRARPALHRRQAGSAPASR